MVTPRHTPGWDGYDLYGDDGTIVGTLDPPWFCEPWWDFDGLPWNPRVVPPPNPDIDTIRCLVEALLMEDP